jgi:hypothetical protein
VRACGFAFERKYFGVSGRLEVCVGYFLLAIEKIQKRLKFMKGGNRSVTKYGNNRTNDLSLRQGLRVLASISL